jgi:hypothetical protein
MEKLTPGLIYMAVFRYVCVEACPTSRVKLQSALPFCIHAFTPDSLLL